MLLLCHLQPTQPGIKAIINTSLSTLGMVTLANSFSNNFHATYPHLSSGIPTSVPAVPLGFNTSNPTLLVSVSDILGFHVPQRTKYGKNNIDLIEVVQSDIDSGDQPKLQ